MSEIHLIMNKLNEFQQNRKSYDKFGIKRMTVENRIKGSYQHCLGSAITTFFEQKPEHLINEKFN